MMRAFRQCGSRDSTPHRMLHASPANHMGAPPLHGAHVAACCNHMLQSHAVSSSCVHMPHPLPPMQGWRRTVHNLMATNKQIGEVAVAVLPMCSSGALNPPTLTCAKPAVVGGTEKAARSRAPSHRACQAAFLRSRAAAMLAHGLDLGWVFVRAADSAWNRNLKAPTACPPSLAAQMSRRRQRSRKASWQAAAAMALKPDELAALTNLKSLSLHLSPGPPTTVTDFISRGIAPLTALTRLTLAFAILDGYNPIESKYTNVANDLFSVGLSLLPVSLRELSLSGWREERDGGAESTWLGPGVITHLTKLTALACSGCMRIVDAGGPGVFPESLESLSCGGWTEYDNVLRDDPHYRIFPRLPPLRPLLGLRRLRRLALENIERQEHGDLAPFTALTTLEEVQLGYGADPLDRRGRGRMALAAAAASGAWSKLPVKGLTLRADCCPLPVVEALTQLTGLTSLVLSCDMLNDNHRVLAHDVIGNLPTLQAVTIQRPYPEIRHSSHRHSDDQADPDDDAASLSDDDEAAGTYHVELMRAIAGLKQLRSLRLLHLEWQTLPTNAMYELRPASLLTRLDLINLNLHDKHVSKVVIALQFWKALQRLDLTGNKALTPKAWVRLRRNMFPALQKVVFPDGCYKEGQSRDW